MVAKKLTLDTFELGACYYPEQWPEELWADDFRRMKELNFSVIRVAEFAWTIFEPTEGSFQFDLFDRAIDLAHHFGLKVILGTPTATPPVWLTHRYPEVLNVSNEGVTYHHGMRRHYNYSSPIYRSLCARITREMAMHYHNHPAVIGWQIDNELNCEINVFYAEVDHIAFRRWLIEIYKDLTKLNLAWGAVFWNQSYTSWDQVHLTRPSVSDSPNPHQALDEKRFISDNTISFAKLQADILREVAPLQWVTTNGIFGHLDSHKMTNDLLDFISYDSYPLFATTETSSDLNPLQDRKWGLNLSMVRAISAQFCVMEQQSGPGGWVNRIELPSPRPGQMRLWTYQSIAHGADMLLYFRWRTATMGTEIYWHGINDYHNLPNRRVEEVARVGRELASVGKLIVRTSFKADIAIVKDYDNEWDGELDTWHGPMEKKSLVAWYKSLQYRHIPVDILTYRIETTLEDLLQYKTLVYPHPTIMTDECARLFEDYVSQGGTVIFGCRTGYKNIHGHCNMAAFPGPVAELCGITVEDFTLIKGIYKAPPIKWRDQDNIKATHADMFNDIIRVQSPTVEIVAEYAAEYYAGKPALTKNSFGQGFAWYYGAAFNESVVGEIIKSLKLKPPIEAICDVPWQVEVAIRESKESSFIFLLNYSDQAETLFFKQKVYDILNERWLTGEVEIIAFDVIIIKLERQP
ncbi:beta-galactosidase [Paenibacillus psychroresistens]|uniref:Beta-galactosidase n=1 Tax=Paenibacillus psychroresistens TaxID=1778678 RepID=A0A6B8RQU1_9BACL|nr:beta-galactosidase [Paenibacillus psychroresistens]QGQ97746.1 beta-galactosidase [Paenibacillus psychroresistens]